MSSRLCCYGASVNMTLSVAITKIVLVVVDCDKRKVHYSAEKYNILVIT